MDAVGAAEKEASEVLHSLLSVERIKDINQGQTSHQVMLVSQSELEQLTTVPVAGEVHWAATTPVSIQQGIYTNMDDNQILWHGPALQISSLENGEFHVHAATAKELSSVALPENQEYPQAFKTEAIQNVDTKPQRSVPESKPKTPSKTAKKHVKKIRRRNHFNKNTTSKTSVDKKVPPVIPDNQKTPLEENAQQVYERFQRGCDCQEDNCFEGMSAEAVYKHRLNIAELTKAEHDMYLMGVTMAVLTNPEQTIRHKERQRLRAQYVFQGRRVCLEAFLYLENCTRYQIKRIRKHVMTHGVAPRVHGNYGKKPHNTFPLDSYRHATEFLKHFLEKKAGLQKGWTTKGKPSPMILPSDITRKMIHAAYKDYCDHFEPSIKVMGYSTFRHFMKEQFPQIRFSKIEPNKLKGIPEENQSETVSSSTEATVLAEGNQTETAVISNVEPTIQQIAAGIPIVLAKDEHTEEVSTANSVPQQQAFLVTNSSLSQIIPANVTLGNAFSSYQLAPQTFHALAQANVGTIEVSSIDGTETTTYTLSAV